MPAETNPASCTVNGREYAITATESGEKYPALRAALLKSGWDGNTYLLTGKRGATYLGYRAVRDGRFEIVSRI